ncbi:AMP-binding protein [uncultured Shimia sp.]|uniref:AMP-binding protein n=1 Tax=uncultured Shimia sp. TaxID=573152 RepID=UPI002621CF13|nr:AMP-binding protein [uncultured Shimia sp.]
MPLRHAIEIHARHRPDAVAVDISGDSLTYGVLFDRITRLHSALTALPGRGHPALSLSKEARLFAVATGNHPATSTLLATAMATPHAVAVLDPQWPDDMLQRTLAKLPPDVVFCLSSQSALIHAAGKLGIPAICVDSGDLDEFLGDGLAPPWTAPDDTFLVGFTSGTTSQPKAFARARHSWRVSLDASRVAFALTDRSHCFAPGPLAHGISMYALAETLDLGATFYGTSRFDLASAHHAMRGAKRIVAVPTLLGVLSHGPAQNHITEITTAGAKLDPALLTRARNVFPRARVHEYYGASELGFVSLNTHGRDSSSAPANSVGHPFAHVSLSIRKDGAEVTQGDAGTIFVRGDLAIDTYLWGGRNSGFRREGPWATVGDIGRLNTDGSLAILGREGGMVITAGHNVYPQEVETALAHISGVEAAVVLGRTHPSRGQEIVAIVETDSALDEIRARLAISLPRYKLPRQFLRTGEWPLTSSGKIARATLQDWLDNEDPRLERFKA